MKITAQIILLMTIVLGTQALVRADPPPADPLALDEQTLCKSDADCVLVKSPCGAPASINIKFKDHYQEKSKMVDQVLFCKNFVRGVWPKDAVARCIDKRCAVGHLKH